MRLTECENCETNVPTQETTTVTPTGIEMEYCEDCYTDYKNRGLAERAGEVLTMAWIGFVLLLVALFVIGIMVELA